MKTEARIALAYMLVSAFASVVNIGTQAASIWIYSGTYAVEIAVL